MATKKLELEKAARGEGCLGRAADDEPLFVLRGQDLLAPALVELWARLAELNGAGADKCQGALLLADQMRYYHTRKFPD